MYFTKYQTFPLSLGFCHPEVGHNLKCVKRPGKCTSSLPFTFFFLSSSACCNQIWGKSPSTRLQWRKRLSTLNSMRYNLSPALPITTIKHLAISLIFSTELKMVFYTASDVWMSIAIKHTFKDLLQIWHFRECVFSASIRMFLLKMTNSLPFNSRVNESLI